MLFIKLNTEKEKYTNLGGQKRLENISEHIQDRWHHYIQTAPLKKHIHVQKAGTDIVMNAKIHKKY